MTKLLATLVIELLRHDSIIVKLVSETPACERVQITDNDFLGSEARTPQSKSGNNVCSKWGRQRLSRCRAPLLATYKHLNLPVSLPSTSS
jgi:hypothetical protein